MPTIEWLRKEFNYGYNSGDVLSWFPGKRRRLEEKWNGGSYRRVFCRALKPYLKPDSTVLELGPGFGSWSRAILKYIPRGVLHTVDFQDVTPWLRPEQYNGRLVCHQTSDNLFSFIEDNSIDFMWSFGVLVHNNIGSIKEILANSRPKMKEEGLVCHEYGDWNKLEKYGWQKGMVPVEFKTKPDDEIWWPRNDKTTMRQVAEETGWHVLSDDLNLLKRDGLILMCRNKSVVYI